MNEIYEILNKHIDNNEYILELDEINNLFEKYQLPYDVRKDILNKINDHNNKIYLKEKIKFNNHVNVSASKSINIDYTSEEKKIYKKEISTINLDINKYLKVILNEKDLDKIESILPNRNDPSFNDILTCILIELYKQQVTIINYIKKEDDYNLAYETFSSELEEIDRKMEFILEYKDKLDIPFNINIDDKNKIVFLKNSSGVPVIFQDLKDCEEFYMSFLSLINSITDGTFKNFRTLVNNDKLTGICEVKGYKTRIYFARLNSNVYVVLSAYIKKCNTSIQHKNFIANLNKNYQIQKQFLLETINNSEYMDQEQTYFYQLTDMLNSRGKVKKIGLN